MIKLLGVLLILVFFLLVFVIRKFFRGSKLSSLKARENNSTGSFGENPEFEVKNKLLDLFLQAQEALLLATTGETKLKFTNEKEKLLYLHFILGAIDQLSKSIENEENRELWITTTSITRASFLFGIDDTIEHLGSYGRSGEPELHNAGEKGWQAMRTYMLSAVGKSSEDDFTKSCLAMFRIVKGN